MPGKFCLNHDNISAAGHCRRCHKPVCQDCIVHAAGHVFCSDTCVNQFAAFKGRWQEKGPTRFGCLWKLAAIILAALILLVALKVIKI